MELQEASHAPVFVEKLIKLNRVAKVVKGGRRFSFSALVVVGDQEGRAGYSIGKANDVSEAIKKGMEQAKHRMVKIPMQGKTIPHKIVHRFKGAKIILMPAVEGTGVIAGGAVRSIMDACGIHDIMGKIQGSRNPVTVVQAVFKAFDEFLDVQEICHARGKRIEELWA